MSRNEYKEICQDMIGAEKFRGSCARVGDRLIRKGKPTLPLRVIVSRLKKKNKGSSKMIHNQPSGSKLTKT